MPRSKLDLHSLSLDELWTLHEKIRSLLAERIVVEKRALETRLLRLNRGKEKEKEALPPEGVQARQRRKYPRVLPKYQNPSIPTETWSGRGKQPRWLISAIQAGGKVEDFKIPDSVNSEKHDVRR
jgi:DNA-binding protein H-NS